MFSKWYTLHIITLIYITHILKIKLKMAGTPAILGLAAVAAGLKGAPKARALGRW